MPSAHPHVPWERYFHPWKRIQCGTWTHADGFPLHDHEFVELVLVTNGTGLYPGFPRTTIELTLRAVKVRFSPEIRARLMQCGNRK